MKLSKNEIKPVLVLTVICLVSALLLAVVNSFTKPVIEAAATERQQASLSAAMADNAGFTKADLPAGAAPTVTEVYRENGGKGYVFLLTTKSQYTGSEKMGITVGIGTDGKVSGVVLTSYSESKDFGKKEYPGTYVGKDASGVAAVDTVAGVTFSSTAFKNAIRDAFDCFALLNK